MSREYFRAVAHSNRDSDLNEEHNCGTEACAYSYATGWVIEAIKNEIVRVDERGKEELKALYEKKDFEEFLRVFNLKWGRYYTVKVYPTDLYFDAEFLPWPEKW